MTEHWCWWWMLFVVCLEISNFGQLWQCDILCHYKPPGDEEHIITHSDQSEDSVQVTWSLSANQRQVPTQHHTQRPAQVAKFWQQIAFERKAPWQTSIALPCGKLIYTRLIIENAKRKKMSGWHYQWIWAPWQPLIMGRCVLTSVTGKFNSTNHRPGLGLIWELPTVSGPMRGQGFAIF